MIDDFSPLVERAHSGPDWFPELRTMPSGPLYRFVAVPDQEPPPPQYVYLEPPPRRARWESRFFVTLTNWNALWEAGSITPDVIRPEWFPRRLRWLLKVKDRNLRLIPRHPWHRYDAYEPLYHVLPAEVLRRVGLPLLKRGRWPYWASFGRVDEVLPRDFDDRLAEAFSMHMWPLLNGRSARRAFSADDPIRVLSHHLDFWLPYIDVIAQRRTRALGRITFKDPDDPTVEQDIQRINAENAGSGVQVCRPCFGGALWRGEEEAWEAAQELVEVADEHGALRNIVDAVRSHRIADDFSPLWSYEREDFERKLYRKRSKVRVTFVELPESVPVYAPDIEVHERFLWGDFLTLLDARERRIAVCLRKGSVGPVDIAGELGYANHSPVSKALNRIRKKAAAFFGLN